METEPEPRKYFIDPRHVAIAVGVFLVLWAVVVFFSRAPADCVPDEDDDIEELYDRRQVLLGLLARVSASLRKHQIPHWLIYRTLLGWYSTKGILRDDYDVDVGVLRDDRSVC